MEKSIKFLGICVLISATLIAVSLLFQSFFNRYEIKVGGDGVAVLDKFTGDVYIPFTEKKYPLTK